MYLKNERYLLHLIIIVVLLFSSKANSDTNDKTKILKYLDSLKYFSASFIQNDGESLSEGKVYIGKKRVRAEYFLPTKILIILDEDKAMYYDYELDEDEFFNPKNTNAWFFYDIFRNPLFFDDSFVASKKNNLVIQKKGIDNGEGRYSIRVYFEKNPIVLRKLEVLINEDMLTLSIYDHNYNEEFDKDFFKLINPKYFN
tara:strand:- start:1396 stop:1992 length:597 start_codon:yes stop_codon:yes gene_type:complete